MTDSQRAEMCAINQRVATLAKLMDQCGQRMQVLRSDVKLSEARNPISNVLRPRPQSPTALYNRPIIDLLALTVTWRGRSCFLGNNNPLNLLDSLAKRPNEYLPMDRLIRDVWTSPISDETFRSTIRGLKCRLRAASMARLANSIQSSRRCYGLILDKVE